MPRQRCGGGASTSPDAQVIFCNIHRHMRSRRTPTRIRRVACPDSARRPICQGATFAHVAKTRGGSRRERRRSTMASDRGKSWRCPGPRPGRRPVIQIQTDSGASTGIAQARRQPYRPARTTSESSRLAKLQHTSRSDSRRSCRGSWFLSIGTPFDSEGKYPITLKLPFYSEQRRRLPALAQSPRGCCGMLNRLATIKRTNACGKYVARAMAATAVILSSQRLPLAPGIMDAPMWSVDVRTPGKINDPPT